MNKSEEQKYSGDGQAHLAACCREKMQKGDVKKISDEEFQANLMEHQEFKSAMGWSKKNDRPF